MLPRTVDDFRKRYAREANDPKGAVRIWLDAMAKYILSMPMRVSDAMNPAAEMVRMCLLDKPEGMSPLPRQWSVRLRSHPYTLWSYIVGATPENDYAFDRNKIEWAIEPSIENLADRAVIWMRSSGTDTPRRITVIYRESRWHVERWEALFDPVTPPKGVPHEEPEAPPAAAPTPEARADMPAPGFADES
jgi:hypothetical protein